MFAEANVDVNTAGRIGLCARLPQGANHFLHHGDVVPAAHRADHLSRGVGDRAVALDHPLAPVGHGNVPVAKVATDVAGGRAE